MVRSKPKKQKGDDAFKKRVQKVGRKKLAPATATRAEVHARTLRISTAASIARANISISGSDAHSSENQLDHGEHTKGKKAVLPTRSFAELLANTNHYRASNRASAFESMSRLLALQEADDVQKRARLDPFAGFISTRSNNNNPNTSSTTNNNKLPISVPNNRDNARPHEVTPLQKLKAFMSALDALTDTEEEVRQAALGSLRVILRNQWLVIAAAGDPRRGSSAQSPGVGEAEMDHIRSILHTVHITLTHALKPVRLSGVELLALLLEYGEPAALRRAAREVSRAQQFVLQAEPTEGDHTLRRQPHAVGETDAKASEVGQNFLQEQTWILALVRRVSMLVLRTKQIYVLPALLSVFLMSSETEANVIGGLPLESVPNEEESDTLDSNWIYPFSNGIRCAAPDWHHPELVLDLFKELLPQWANMWKELMELQLALFRHEEKLFAAVALGSSFAIVLTFLKQKEMERRDGVTARSGAKDAVGRIFLSKSDLQTVKKLFFQKVPVTTAEILRKENRDHDGVQSSSLLSNLSSGSVGASSRTKYNRVDFALVLAQVSTPLATLEEGWNGLYQYFHTAFSAMSHFSSPPRSEVQLSSRHLLGSLEVYLLTLCLFPNLIRISEASFPTSGTFDFNEIKVPGEGRQPVTDAHQVAEHSVRPSRPFDKISQKFLPFAPLLLRATIQHIQKHLQGGSARPKSRNLKQIASDDEKDALLSSLLSCATAIVVRLAQFPLTLADSVEWAEVLRDQRAGKMPRNEIQHSKQSGKGNFATAQALHDTFLLVPRFLFALRLHISPKETNTANEQSDEDKSEQDSVSKKQSRHDAASSIKGVLVNHPAVVDNVFYQMLRVLWFMISSGHPLFSEDSRGVDTPSKFVLMMRVGLQALFAVPDSALGSRVHRGVLSRCTRRTVELAQHILFYLNVRDVDRMRVLTMGETSADDEGFNLEEGEEHSRDDTMGHATMSTKTGMADILLMLPPPLPLKAS
ncbi:unnamed protein product [Phytomonas sp. Hart1]|nr:unnamed protein product [Phytomonas sp. Hart1]|eukprot:CCW66003.1 unnamed protein product [Phytomonas sp. isolate Hart1]